MNSGGNSSVFSKGTWAKCVEVVLDFAESLGHDLDTGTVFQAIESVRLGEIVLDDEQNSQLRKAVFTNRQGWTRIKNAAVEMSAGKCVAWLCLVLVYCEILAADAVLEDSKEAPLDFKKNDLLSQIDKRLETTSEQLDQDYGPHAWKNFRRAAFSLYAECVSRHQSRSSAADSAREKTLKQLIAYRRLHDLDGMRWLHNHQSDIRDAVQTTFDRGDMELLAEPFRHMNHQFWALEWPELRANYTEDVADFLVRDKSPINRLRGLNLVVQRRFDAALQALVDGQGLNAAFNIGNIVNAVGETCWDELRTLAPKTCNIDRRFFFEVSAELAWSEALALKMALPQEARDRYRTAMRFASRTGNQSLFISIARQYAAILDEQGDLTGSKRLLSILRQLALRHRNDRRLVQLDMDLAKMYKKRGEDDLAIQHATDARIRFDSIQDPVGTDWYQPSWRQDILETLRHVTA